MVKHYSIKTKQAGARVLILAGVHGDEYEPMLAAMQLLEELPDLLVRGRVIVVPVVHEDAFLIEGRCGIDSLDLARICPGDATGTITEKCAAELSKLIKSTDYLIDMHTGGLLYDIFPMVGYMLHPNSDVLEKQQQMAIASGLPLIWGTDHRPNGRTLSVARDQNIPAIYFEYGGGTGLREQVVDKYKESCVRILSVLGLLKDPIVVDPSYTYWLEDHHPDSGHLQIKMPAPIQGIFKTAVLTGDYVRKEQVFGEIINPISGECKTVHAEVDGLVFLLRTTVFVQKGEALGGILPVELFAKKTIKENEGNESI